MLANAPSPRNRKPMIFSCSLTLAPPTIMIGSGYQFSSICRIYPSSVLSYFRGSGGCERSELEKTKSSRCDRSEHENTGYRGYPVRADLRSATGRRPSRCERSELEKTKSSSTPPVESCGKAVASHDSSWNLGRPRSDHEILSRASHVEIGGMNESFGICSL